MKLGADPEFFLLDENNNFINAITALPFTKNKPCKIGNNSTIFCDNVLGEFNFEPAKNCEEFVLACVKGKVCSKDKAGNHRMSFLGYAEFDEKELKNKNAREYGCTPDFNAYTLTESNPPRELFKKYNCRTAGGHIHIGGMKTDLICNPVYKPLYVFMLDLFLAIPSVLIDNSAESYRRRQYFGSAGTYRDKDYGLEYRVLSPFWLRHESTMGLMYLICDFVFQEMNENIYRKFYNFKPEKLKSEKPEDAYECWGYDSSFLRKTIDTNNYSGARKLFNFACNFMPNKLIELIEYEINNPKPLFF